MITTTKYLWDGNGPRWRYYSVVPLTASFIELHSTAFMCLSCSFMLRSPTPGLYTLTPTLWFLAPSQCQCQWGERQFSEVPWCCCVISAASLREGTILKVPLLAEVSPTLPELRIFLLTPALSQHCLTQTLDSSPFMACVWHSCTTAQEQEPGSSHLSVIVSCWLSTAMLQWVRSSHLCKAHTHPCTLLPLWKSKM